MKSLHLSYILFLLAISSCITQESKTVLDQSKMITSGQPWLTTTGETIEAHGGGILHKDGAYYWYGENHSKGFGNQVGISGYRSSDLFQWESMGVVMPKDSFPALYQDNGVAERPKVIFNPKTQQYVMWIHLDTHGYTTATAGIATSNNPEGPFTMLKIFRPLSYDYGYNVADNPVSLDERLKQINEHELGNTYRDMNLFVDGDQAYVIYASENNATLYISKLNDTFTDIKQPSEIGKTWNRAIPFGYREAPAPFKYKNKYYLITSGLTGWAPNKAEAFVADNMLGTWTSISNPFVGPNAEHTFHSQSTFVLSVNDSPDNNQFIYMGDRWNGQEIVKSTYIWQPFVMKDDGSFEIYNLNKWQMEVFKKSSISKQQPQLSQQKIEDNKILNWTTVDGCASYHVLEGNSMVATLTENSYTLPKELAGTLKNYTVYAFNINGELSGQSSNVQVTWDDPQTIFLDEVIPNDWKQGFGELQFGKSLQGGNVRINDSIYEHGLGTHAPSEITYILHQNYGRFSCVAGIDFYPSTVDTSGSTAIFKVFGDGKLLFESGVLRIKDEPLPIDIDIKGINQLKLIVYDAGDGSHYDHVNWANPRLLND